MDLFENIPLSKTMLIFIILGAIAILFYLGYRLHQDKKHEGFGDHPAHSEQEQEHTPSAPAAQAPCLCLLYATWCGHCKTFKPEWEKLKGMLASHRGLTLREIEEKEPEMQKHSTAGFPTIRFFPKGIEDPGLFVDYKGQRNTESILEFLKEHRAL
jgi:thiol-disulfide isomerase/thioredoxin